MMLKKHVLGTLLICCTAPVFANIPIESRGLSQNSSTSYAPNNTQSAISTGSDQTVATNLNWQLMQKNQQLEDDIRTLRGKIEEHDNEIEKLKNELNNRYADLDQRLEALQQKVEPTEDTSTEEDNQQGTVPSTATGSTPNSSTIKSSSATAPALANSNSVTKPASAPAATSEELDKAAYTVALDAYKQGGAKKAIAPMQNFIKNNPNSVYVSNAHFWLAEFNVAIEPSNFAEAKRNYTIVVEQYPNSSRASRALYQLYSISKDVDHNANQANLYKQQLLKSYPKSEEAGYLK